MNIGEIVKRSGLSSKMIRDYKKIGLIRSAGRSESGYRHYTKQNLENLSFIRHVRDVDFSLAQAKVLLQLKSSPQCTSVEVKRLTAEHTATLQAKIDRSQDTVNTLRDWYDRCCGDNHPDCPTIEQFSDTESCRTNTEAV